MADRLIAALRRLVQYLTLPDPSDFVQLGASCPRCHTHVEPRDDAGLAQCRCGELVVGDRADRLSGL